MAEKTVRLKIRRQADPEAKPYWEEFELAWRPGMNVISAMMEIAANPVTRAGKATTPITPQMAPHKPLMRIVCSTISPALSRRPAPLDMRCIAWPNLVAVYLSPSASLASAGLCGIHPILQLALQL